MAVEVQKIAPGVEGYYINNNRFNTTLVAYNFYIPLNAETMAADALLPYILTSCCEKYPDYIDLNLCLSKLYGADLSCLVAKNGDCFHIKIAVSAINNNLSFDSCRPVDEAAQLLNELIFAPSLDGESFRAIDMQREKRKTVERIETEINNKRAFAKTRLFEEMFGDDPYGRFSYGTVKEVNTLTGEALYTAWKRLLETAFVRINVIGPELPQSIFTVAESKFKNIMRHDITEVSTVKELCEAAEVNYVTERFDVKQGKLAMGFTTEIRGSLRQSAALSLCTDILGGGPYSKLFENVREKQSLCYYCSASAGRIKGFVTVESGIEEVNAEKVVDAVIKELDDIKNGNFDDSVLLASKKAISDSLAGTYDNASAIDMWYSRDVFDTVTPEEATEIVTSVSRDDVINAAKGIKLHTVYRLLPKAEVKQ